MCSRMWDIPARASGSVVLPDLTHAWTATTGDDGFGRITTVSPFGSWYLSTNAPPPSGGVAPPATAANAAQNVSESDNARMLIGFSREALSGLPPMDDCGYRDGSGRLPDSGDQGGQKDRQAQPHRQDREAVPADHREDEDVLDHGMAGCEEQPHQEQLPVREVLLLRHADDDPGAVCEAEEDPREERDGGVPGQPHAPHRRLHDVPGLPEDGEVAQHLEDRHQGHDDEDQLGGERKRPEQRGGEGLHHPPPRSHRPRSRSPAAQAITSRHRVSTHPRAPVVERTPPSTIRLWAIPIIRPHCVTWNGVRCSGTITAMAAYRFSRKAATKAKAASPGRPKSPITGE